MKTVFMYAGQGSQKELMGKDIYEGFSEFKNLIDSLDLGDRVKELMFNSPLETLSKTENTQPAMAAMEAGITEVLKAKGIIPNAAFGLSLGEYGALFASNVFDANTYINITEFRGRVMSECAAIAPPCCMSAIFGVSSSVVEEGCKANLDKGFVTVANYNCTGQYVICGDEIAVLETEKWLKANGARRCIRLNVSGPFHTRYMEEAATRLREYIDNIEFNKPNIEVVLNVTGDFYNGSDNLKALLEKQVKSSIYLEDSIKRLLDKGYNHFVEIGSGNVLSGFVKKMAKGYENIEIFSIENAEKLESYISYRCKGEA